MIRRDPGYRPPAKPPPPKPAPPEAPTVRLRRPGAPPARPRKPRRKRAWGQLISLTLVIIVLLISAGILGGTLWLETALHRAAGADGLSRPAGVRAG